MKKRIYTILGLLTFLGSTAFAQKELSLTPIAPVNNQTYPNFATDDTLRISVILKNEGPENLNATDSVKVWLDLDWVISQTGYIYFDTYSSTELNCATAGGSDTISYELVQGATIGTTSGGEPIIVNIPSNKSENNIMIKTYGFNNDTLFNDQGVAFDDNGDLVITGNNLVNPQNVVFGTPLGIRNTNVTRTSLSIFPNPACNQISFTNEFKATTTAVVKITDITGRIVKTINLGRQNAGTKTYNIDIEELNNAVYNIELTTDDASSISKFTKTKL